MTKHEMVVKGLNLCANGMCDYRCPYNNINEGCRKKLMLDALEWMNSIKPQKNKPEAPEDREVTVHIGDDTWFFDAIGVTCDIAKLPTRMDPVAKMRLEIDTIKRPVHMKKVQSGKDTVYVKMDGEE